MKKIVLFSVVIMVLSLAVAAFAATPIVKVRVVNLTVLGEDKVLDDKGIVETATMSIGENPEIFPALGGLLVTVGKDGVAYVPDVTVPAGSLNLAGSITEAEKLEYISVAYPDRAGKFDVALVSRDGSVRYIDDEVVIDYGKRAISTMKPIIVKDGDVLLIFTKDAKPIQFRGGETDPAEQEYNPNDHPTFDNRGQQG